MTSIGYASVPAALLLLSLGVVVCWWAMTPAKPRHDQGCDVCDMLRTRHVADPLGTYCLGCRNEWPCSDFDVLDIEEAA